MKPVKQRIVHPEYGDCFPACLASLLELPIEVIPNDHSHTWMAVQRLFLGQFGLEITFHNSDGPIWSDSPWIASVKSKNFDGGSHAILMTGHTVLFDPSTKVGYRKGESLLGKKDVTGGYIMRVANFSLLHELDDYRKRIGYSE